MLKHLLSLSIAAAAFAMVPSASAQMKIGTLDMNSIFTQYFRTKDAETKLNEARAAAKKELDDRLDEVRDLVWASVRDKLLVANPRYLDEE